MTNSPNVPSVPSAPISNSKKILLKALDVFSPRLLLAVQKENFDNLKGCRKIEALRTDEDKSMFAKNHNFKVLAQLTKQSLLSCVQVDVQLNSADAEYSETCLLEGLEVSKKVIIDKVKESLDVLRRCVTAESEECRTVRDETEEILQRTAITEEECTKLKTGNQSVSLEISPMQDKFFSKLTEMAFSSKRKCFQTEKC
ncbi:hypothetical protein L596_017334 [Steinernema carpocapsae]|uniref:Uncharacterized protein n=1 Tax=Steinernema carpocapsae TaxID=34508 RepID=A0A4V6A1Q5_STECR|nr:hypothetical protein L596_017334 [Steinernema carpocapsae]